MEEINYKQEIIDFEKTFKRLYPDAHHRLEIRNGYYIDPVVEMAWNLWKNRAQLDCKMTFIDDDRPTFNCDH